MRASTRYPLRSKFTVIQAHTAHTHTQNILFNLFSSSPSSCPFSVHGKWMAHSKIVRRDHGRCVFASERKRHISVVPWMVSIAVAAAGIADTYCSRGFLIRLQKQFHEPKWRYPAPFAIHVLLLMCRAQQPASHSVSQQLIIFVFPYAIDSITCNYRQSQYILHRTSHTGACVLHCHCRVPMSISHTFGMCRGSFYCSINDTTSTSR